MRILITDDSKSVHSFMKVLFSDGHHELVHAYNGKEALAKVSEDSDIDLVLLDWEMPELDGLATLQELRKSNFTKPIVMVTSRNDLDMITAALESGANEYVMKPFDKEILLEKLEMVFGGKIAS